MRISFDFESEIKSSRRRLMFALAMMLCLAGARRVGLAQEPGEAQLQSRSSVGVSGTAVLRVSSEDYRIGPGDVIAVKVEKADELSRTFQVTAQGTIDMNYVGTIDVGKKTTLELQALIANQLRGRYLKNPYVTVTVMQRNTLTFFIQGAVRSPGAYQIAGQPSLLTLITLAGGLEKGHGSTAFIVRKAKTEKPDSENSASVTSGAVPAEDGPLSSVAGTERFEMLKVNIDGLLKRSVVPNAQIEPGDLINIPFSDVFFVAGEVRKPGSFALKQGTTLRQAISLAEGMTFKASAGKGLIFREDASTGKREEIPVDIAAVMKGTNEDLVIMPNDVVVVPNSRFKSITSVILNGPLLGSIGLLY